MSRCLQSFLAFPKYGRILSPYSIQQKTESRVKCKKQLCRSYSDSPGQIEHLKPPISPFQMLKESFKRPVSMALAAQDLNITHATGREIMKIALEILSYTTNAMYNNEVESLQSKLTPQALLQARSISAKFAFNRVLRFIFDDKDAKHILPWAFKSVVYEGKNCMEFTVLVLAISMKETSQSVWVSSVIIPREETVSSAEDWKVSYIFFDMESILEAHSD